MPQRKVGVGALTGAITSLIVWVVGLGGLTIPPEQAAGLTTILTFLASYLVPAEK